MKKLFVLLILAFALVVLPSCVQEDSEPISNGEVDQASSQEERFIVAKDRRVTYTYPDIEVNTGVFSNEQYRFTSSGWQQRSVWYGRSTASWNDAPAWLESSSAADGTQTQYEDGLTAISQQYVDGNGKTTNQVYAYQGSEKFFVADSGRTISADTLANDLKVVTTPTTTPTPTPAPAPTSPTPTATPTPTKEAATTPVSTTAQPVVSATTTSSLTDGQIFDTNQVGGAEQIGTSGDNTVYRSSTDGSIIVVDKSNKVVSSGGVDTPSDFEATPNPPSAFEATSTPQRKRTTAPRSASRSESDAAITEVLESGEDRPPLAVEGTSSRVVRTKDGRTRTASGSGTTSSTSPTSSGVEATKVKVKYSRDADGNILAYTATSVERSRHVVEEAYISSVKIEGTLTPVFRTNYYNGETGILESTTYQKIELKDGADASDGLTADEVKFGSNKFPQGTGETVSVDPFGNVIEYDKANGEWVRKEGELTAYEQQIQTKAEYTYIYSAFSKAQGWSVLSSLFCGGSCVEDWALSVDKIFHDAYLGTEYWVEGICSVISDLGEVSESSILTANEDGLLYQSAAISATKQKIKAPEGDEYLYTVSWFIQNPTSSGKSSKRASSNSGTISRSGSSTSGLDRDERSIWNS